MRRALFLDRDGVVNADAGFVHRAEDFVFFPAVFPLVRGARALGYTPVIVTNQSGIGRGYFTLAQYESMTAWMLARFAAEQAPIDKVYFCPHHPDAALPEYRHPAPPWRKPAPGMLLAARDEFNLDLGTSAMIGDRWVDAEAGAAAGVPHLALIGDRPDRDGAPPNPPAVTRLAALHDALPWLDSLTAP